ncbi:hypothetical protein M9R32_06730 [Paenisporosarcina quisquiliarum]|uniref:Uncharacterized protein n=1 Tax=Paenisporosarcina quisquiliarum TaxID=365346 RepID=A0A9X3LF33_9BACL|nr:hypothetical protein [Paenisporosarcina quisquiliarum]MCZ8536873.1 hypothetical protein [Paenisporosarcina quisquiliarum]
MLKNEKLTIAAFLLAFSEGIYYTFKARDYAYMEDYMIHISILIMVIFFTFILYVIPTEPHEQSEKNRKLFILYGILIGLPIYYFVIQPQYTFQEAELLIEQKEKVELPNKDNAEKFNAVDFGWKHTKKVPNLQNQEDYFISAIKDGKILYYIFDPRTGDYLLFKP